MSVSNVNSAGHIGDNNNQNNQDVGQNTATMTGHKVVEKKFFPEVETLKKTWELMRSYDGLEIAASIGLPAVFEAKTVSDSELLAFLDAVGVQKDANFFIKKDSNGVETPSDLRETFEQSRPEAARKFFAATEEHKEEKLSEKVLKLKETWEELGSGSDRAASANKCYDFLMDLFWGTHGVYDDDDLLCFLHTVGIRPRGGFFFSKGQETGLRGVLETSRAKVAQVFFAENPLENSSLKNEKELSQEVKRMKEFWEVLPKNDDGIIRGALQEIFTGMHTDQDVLSFLRAADIRPNGEFLVYKDKETGVERSMSFQREFKQWRPKILNEFFAAPLLNEEPKNNNTHAGTINNNDGMPTSNQSHQNNIEGKFPEELEAEGESLQELISNNMNDEEQEIATDVLFEIIKRPYNDQMLLEFFRFINLEPNSVLFTSEAGPTELLQEFEEVRPELAQVFFGGALIEEKKPTAVEEDKLDNTDRAIPRNELVPIYNKNVHQYPKSFETRVDGPLLCRSGSEEKEYAQITSLSMYLREALPRSFLASEGNFDLYDIHFQNLAIRLLERYDLSAMPVVLKEQGGGSQHRRAITVLFRARFYAIATRSDVSWQGKIVDPSYTVDKQAILEENKKTLVLRDWGLKPTNELDKSPGGKSTEFFVKEMATKDAVIEFARQYPHLKTAWVNLANAHKSGGGSAIGTVSQEESTASEGDSLAVLGSVSEITDDGRATYKDGFHIPAGGNYFHKMHFFTNDGPVECYTIVQPFADFRELGYSERADFFSIDGSIKDPDLYRERVKLDIRSVLRTAKSEEMDIVVLGASGCGIFLHDAEIEANSWREVLQEQEFQGHFEKACFAIIGKANLVPFQKAFKGITG